MNDGPTTPVRTAIFLASRKKVQSRSGMRFSRGAFPPPRWPRRRSLSMALSGREIRHNPEPKRCSCATGGSTMSGRVRKPRGAASHPRHSSRSDHAGRAHRLCARWGQVLRREGHSADFAELAGEFRPRIAAVRAFEELPGNAVSHHPVGDGGIVDNGPNRAVGVAAQVRTFP